MECWRCEKKNNMLNCRKCDMPFVERDIHLDQDEEEEQEIGFFKGVATVGIAFIIVAVIAGAIYWWAGL